MKTFLNVLTGFAVCTLVGLVVTTFAGISPVFAPVSGLAWLLLMGRN